MIRRSPRPTEHFTIVRNDVIRDNRLTFRARGLLIELLSRPDNWTIRSSQIAADAIEGRAAILSALRELREVGYIVAETKRQKNGRLLTEQVVFDVPVRKIANRLAVTANDTANDVKQGNQPESGNRNPVDRNPVDRTPDSWNSLEEQNRNTEKKKDISSASEDAWNEFWAVYPRKKDKQAALKAWKKAVKAGIDPTVIIEAARRYAEERATEDPQYTKYPASWLNAGSWDNQPDPAAPAKPGTRQTQVDKVRSALQRTGRLEQRELNP